MARTVEARECAILIALVSTALWLESAVVPAHAAPETSDAVEVVRNFISSEPRLSLPQTDRAALHVRAESPVPGRVAIDIVAAQSGALLGSASVDTATGQLRSLQRVGAGWTDLRQRELIAVAAARCVAEEVAQRHWPVSNLASAETTGEIDGQGCYQFHWRERSHYVETLHLEVRIQAWDRELDGFRISVHPRPSEIPPPKIPVEAASQRAVEEVARREGVLLQDVHVPNTPSRKADRTAVGEVYYWRVDVEIMTADRSGSALVRVSDDGREVGPFEVKWAPPQAPSDAPAGTVGDYHTPVFATDGTSVLAVGHHLRWAGYPPWLPDAPHSAVLCALGSGAISLLRPIIEKRQPLIRYEYGASVPHTNQLLLSTRYDEPYSLCSVDLADGRVRRLGMAQPVRWNYRFTASVRAICGSGVRSQGDSDIWLIPWADEANKLVHLQWVRLPGSETAPEFLPGGDQLIFGHCEPGDEATEGGWALMRVRVGADLGVSEPVQVANGFGQIGRMTAFRGGTLALVWHAGGLTVVDMASGEKSALVLPELADVELLPNGPALSARDFTVSDDGRLLAFSGLAPPEQPATMRWRHIYTCKLDGTDLRRLTPASSAEVAPYVYPVSGEEALAILADRE